MISRTSLRNVELMLKTEAGQQPTHTHITLTHTHTRTHTHTTHTHTHTTRTHNTHTHTHPHHTHITHTHTHTHTRIPHTRNSCPTYLLPQGATGERMCLLIMSSLTIYNTHIHTHWWQCLPMSLCSASFQQSCVSHHLRNHRTTLMLCALLVNVTDFSYLRLSSAEASSD